MEAHRNSRYEYTTREFHTEPGVVTPEFEAEMESAGWQRAWADVTMEGTFAVYRRERRVKWAGFHEDKDLPVKKGDTVTIRKGTCIGTMLPNPEDRVRVAGRTYKVVVDHVLNGVTTGGDRSKHLSNPKVRWPGEGGYWFEVDINDLPEAQ